MNITFTATTQSSEVSLALAKLITNSPQKTLDEIISDLILGAASAVKRVPDKDELLPDVIAVTEFILENIRPTNNTRIDDWVDTCYKRGIVTRDYTLDRAQLHRVCKWVLDDLILHPRFRTDVACRLLRFYPGSLTMAANKPTRKAVKQAIRNVACLTGITIRQARPLTKDKAFLRNTDHFIKAKRCYPVSVDGTPTTVDTDKPFEVTFEFQNNGKCVQPSPLVPVPKPMTRMTPEKMSEMMNVLQEFVKKSPVTFIMSTPGRCDGDNGADHIAFFASDGSLEGLERQLHVSKPRPMSDPTFTFEVPTSWKALDDDWARFLKDEKFFNQNHKGED